MKLYTFSFFNNQIEDLRKFLNLNSSDNNISYFEHPISNEPRYFDKIVKAGKSSKQYRLLIHSSETIHKPAYSQNYLTYYFNVVIRPIHYLEIDSNGKVIKQKIYCETDTQYLKAHTTLEHPDSKIFIDGANGVKNQNADFAIQIDELRGIKLGSLALNAIVRWAQSTFPNKHFADLTLTDTAASIDNYTNKERRDSLYTSVGFKIPEKSSHMYGGYGDIASKHIYSNSSFGFTIYRIDNEILHADYKYCQLHENYKDKIIELQCMYHKKIKNICYFSGTLIAFIIITFLL